MDSETSSIVMVNGAVDHGEVDPVVIVGMACRLPGDISSPDDLWQFMVDQKSAQGSVPPERYNIDGYYHPAGGKRSGATNIPGGYFINQDIREFDNGFFGINNLEATYMDPQQRKLLEVAYEALANSGTTMESVSGSTTGVFVANFSVDYQPGQTRDPDYMHRYTATGSGATVMSNRISHVLNLHGPSMTVDTACSSSIFALHQALNAIAVGDCEDAIVASANLIMSPELLIGAAVAGVLSPTGTSHTFDASADGYGRAEGINAIYVKRLSAALRDGNPIRAVIRGSAVNASGRTPGISLPSGRLQEVVMRKAYRDAGLDFADTDYVECHGTGTPVGDPIEVDAVGRCFARPGEGAPLLIGSVKTNVGHSEAASGLTSIIKVVKSFENGKIAPTYGVKKLNPKLILKERNIQIATKVEEWPRAVRRASINSFGYGGANGHLILEGADSYLGRSSPRLNGVQLNGNVNGNGVHVNGNGPHVNGNGVHANGNGIHVNGNSTLEEQGAQPVMLPISAASPNALKIVLQKMAEAFDKPLPEEVVRDVAHTLTKGRDALRHRGYLVATYDDSVGGYTSTASDITSSGLGGSETLPFGFVFTGQGAQYAGMGKELLAQSKHFRDTIRGLDEILQGLKAPYQPSWTLEQTLLDDAKVSKINEVTHSQPICTAVQIALVDLLKTWGVEPKSVVGHSSGEIAAAYAAGLLTSSQAILVAYYRGYAVGELRSKGQMMAAGLGPEPAQTLIEEKGLLGQVRVACVNSPQSVTISGSPEAVEALQEELQAKQKFARKLETGGRAYHSHMMEEIGPLYEELLKPVFQKKDKTSLSEAETEREVKMYSSVGHSAESISVMDAQRMGAAYWRQNLEQPVQFAAALSSLATDNEKIHLIEVGPHSALKGPIQQTRKALGSDEKSVPYSSTLVRKESASVQLATLAGNLFTHGYDLAWAHVNGLTTGKAPKIDSSLAPYPWDYSGDLLFEEPRVTTELRNRKYIRHELLGTAAYTGSGVDFSWRNILKPTEMPWITDHKLEEQVVFPAAAYVATAIEAISQATGIKKDLQNGRRDVGFELRNVNISAALNIPAENDKAGKDLELHTILSPRKTSGAATTSSAWYDFSISSLFWTSGLATVHCTGSIRVTERKQAAKMATTKVENNKGFDHWASTAKWYSKWHDEGLCFGPQFQSLTSLRTDSARKRREFVSTARTEPVTVGGSYEYYPVHPITIDAAIQTACLSGTAGHVAALRTWLPVYIAEAHIQPPVQATGDAECEIHVKSEEMGLSSRRFDGTIIDANGDLVVDFKDSRIALYSGSKSLTAATAEAAEADPEKANPLDMYLQRQPTLRINWRPDVQRLGGPNSAAQILSYLSEFLDTQHPDIRDDESMAVIGGLLELAGHKTPRMRVLEIGGDEQGYKANLWQTMLGKKTAYSRVRSWHTGTVDVKGDISVEDGSEELFDAVLVPKHALSSVKSTWDKIGAAIAENGVVIARKSEAAITGLQKAGFHVLDLRNNVLLALRRVDHAVLSGRDALIIHTENPSAVVTGFADVLSTHLKREAGITSVNIVALSQLDNAEINGSTICISLLEVEREFLATMDPTEMNRLRSFTDKANDLLWLTGADMLGSEPNPNLTLSSGLSRALMLEQPTLRWSVLDVGKQLQDAANYDNICDNAVKALVARFDKDDCEFISINGLLNVSRYSPDFEINSLFRSRLEPQKSALVQKSLIEANPARLTINRPGMTDTIHFQELREPGGNDAPQVGFVDIEIKSVGLSARDANAMSGKAETRENTTATDFAGVVTAIGPHTETTLRPGDRVVSFAPFHIGTTARVPASSVQPLLDNEDFHSMSSLGFAYGTAIYALKDRANLRRGESVLIHADSGSFGIAAIALAQKLGATVFTTCASEAKSDYLVKQLGVPVSHIFNSGDSSFVQGIFEATNGRGVDVIINSIVDDLHDSWEKCLADFGRFVEVGRRELLDAGRLDMRAFLRGVTFTAFDITEMFWSKDPYHRANWGRLLVDTLQLYRTGQIPQLPAKVFDIAQVSEAYRFFTTKDRVGEAVLSLEDSQTQVSVAPAPHSSIFDPEKVYLLIGCLGGLGRSLSRWMVTRGARHFVFLGRSGADKPSAKELVTRLESAGATVGVVRGDVSNFEDVKAAVEYCVSTGRQIGGAVQAAMGLHEALFTVMSNEAWHTGIDPKYQGTWNMHNALEGHDLDFFVLTSSVSGTVGTATESNYCAANGFLDSFARWRRSQGKACIAIGLGMISEVGYLHENPEIEALLLRKGIQPLNEDEFLQVLDLALTSEAERDINKSHLLTGLEPDAVRALSARGFDVTTHGVLVEARCSILLGALQTEQEVAARANSDSQGASAALSKTAAPWFKEVPAALSATFAPEASADTMKDAIVRLIKKRFSNLILMPIDQIEEHKALPEFGVDSMIASEFRSWFWSALKVDVPFLDIMSPQKSLLAFANIVEGKVKEGASK